ncbi:MAG: hypothetical protein ACRDYY_18145 [Acidimicrobiales bacterium]
MADQASAQVAGGDWTVQAADRFESVVVAVADKTAVPATKVARMVVFGIVAGLLGIVILLLLVIGVIRVLDVYLPFHPLARRVWVVDAGMGGIFLGVGTLLWRKRRPKRT